VTYGEVDAQTSVLPERPITLTLTANSASGSSGCNTYRAVPTYREEFIRFERIISTRMACPEALMAQERTYLEALSNVQDYRVVDGQLVLRYGERGRLTFVRVPTFIESTWQLIAYGAPNALIPAVGEVTLRFAESRAEGSTVCSAYSASYAVGGDSLSFSALISTRQPCPTAELSQQEQAFLKALERVTHYAESGDELILHYGAGERLIFKRASAQ
jgi:heat shock protein HslJ